MSIKDAHIWVAKFDSAKRLEKYMEEDFEAEEDGSPISEFAKDQQVDFYDHDLVFAEFKKGKKVAPQQLINGWGFAKKAVTQVVTAIEKLGDLVRTPRSLPTRGNSKSRVPPRGRVTNCGTLGNSRAAATSPTCWTIARLGGNCGSWNRWSQRPAAIVPRSFTGAGNCGRMA